MILLATGFSLGSGVKGEEAPQDLVPQTKSERSDANPAGDRNDYEVSRKKLFDELKALAAKDKPKATVSLVMESATKKSHELIVASGNGDAQLWDSSGRRIIKKAGTSALVTTSSKRAIEKINEAILKQFGKSTKQPLAAHGMTAFYLFDGDGVKQYTAPTEKLAAYTDKLSRIYAQFTELRGVIEFAQRADKKPR